MRHNRELREITIGNCMHLNKNYTPNVHKQTNSIMRYDKKIKKIGQKIGYSQRDAKKYSIRLLEGWIHTNTKVQLMHLK